MGLKSVRSTIFYTPPPEHGCFDSKKNEESRLYLFLCFFVCCADWRFTARLCFRWLAGRQRGKIKTEENEGKKTPCYVIWLCCTVFRPPPWLSPQMNAAPQSVQREKVGIQELAGESACAAVPLCCFVGLVRCVFLRRCLFAHPRGLIRKVRRERAFIH